MDREEPEDGLDPISADQRVLLIKVGIVGFVPPQATAVFAVDQSPRPINLTGVVGFTPIAPGTPRPTSLATAVATDS